MHNSEGELKALSVRVTLMFITNLPCHQPFLTVHLKVGRLSRWVRVDRGGYEREAASDSVRSRIERSAGVVESVNGAFLGWQGSVRLLV